MRLGIILIICLSLIPAIAFAGVGLSPSTVYFEKMVRGGYAEKYITVSNPTDEDVSITVAVEGEISGWFDIEPKNFNLSGIGFKIVRVIARPPSNIPNGVYRGRVLIISKPVMPPEAPQGSVIRVASVVAADALVEVSDVQLMRYNVEKLDLPSTEECRPIIITAYVRNTGNVNVTPSFHIEIKSLAGQLVKSYDYKAELPILPTTSKTIFIRVPYEIEHFKCIPEGTYIAEITAYTDDGSVMDKSSIKFKIYKRGVLTVAGELIELKAPKNITLGEVAKVEALFKNTGQIPVAAKLNVEVYSGGRLVQTLSSDPVEVYMGGVNPLTVYFKPGFPGKYTLSAIANFEQKTSNVLQTEIDVLVPLYYWVILFVALILVFLFVYYKKRKGSK